MLPHSPTSADPRPRHPLLGRRRRRAALALALSIALWSVPASAQVTTVPTAVAGFVGEAMQGPVDQPTVVESFAEFATLFGAGTTGLARPHLAPSVEAFFLNGGARAWIVRTTDGSDAALIGSAGGPGPATGLRALRAIDEITLVAVPGATSPAVHVAMLADCELLADRLCLLDPASRDDVSAVLAERAGIASPQGFGALYFPWFEAFFAGATVDLPPSGVVAGVMSRNDAQYGVWNPPAGPTGGVVLGVTGLTYDLSSAEQSLLNPEGVNAIRDVSGSGILLFGARTLATNLDFRFVSTRRLAAVVSESIEEGTSYARSQPNDASLWAQIEADATSYLTSLFAAGAFAGSTVADAFFVRCDSTTMTALDLAEGRTVLLVGIAPVQPGQFVVLRIEHVRGAPVPVPGLALPGLVILAALCAGLGTRRGGHRRGARAERARRVPLVSPFRVDRLR